MVEEGPDAEDVLLLAEGEDVHEAAAEGALMASRYYSEFPERKVSAPSPVASREGVSAKPGAISERTAPWPKPGPTWGSSFNRKTNAAVVKTRAAKHGVD